MKRREEATTAALGAPAPSTIQDPADVGPGRPSVKWTDDRLVRACLHGDGDAWQALIMKYRRLIYSVPVKYGATPDDANDVFQAVCVELYAHLPKLQRAESLPAWLATVARHQSFHWKRGRTKRLEREGGDLDVAEASAAVSDEDLLERTQEEQLVREALLELPVRCRQLVSKLFFEQPPRPYAEIAAELGLATGSIGFIRGRCLKKLQQSLAKAGVAR
ncbi:MAG: sigma-70 family RNA polymerase sigma factor [Vicinamibacterales bacterium]